MIDPAKGTFGRIALGDPRRRVERLLGRPLRHGLDEPAEPVGEDYYEIGGPTHFRSPYPDPKAHEKEDVLRYRSRVVFMSAGGVYGWVSTSPRARTRQGVAIGDGQAVARRRYRDARCYTANEGTEWVTFPLCEVLVCPGRRLYFGADPIKSIWLVASSRRALTSACMAAARR